MLYVRVRSSHKHTFRISDYCRHSPCSYLIVEIRSTFSLTWFHSGRLDFASAKPTTLEKRFYKIFCRPVIELAQFFTGGTDSPCVYLLLIRDMYLEMEEVLRWEKIQCFLGNPLINPDINLHSIKLALLRFSPSFLLLLFSIKGASLLKKFKHYTQPMHN
jgi:hypothetical protein